MGNVNFHLIQISTCWTLTKLYILSRGSKCWRTWMVSSCWDRTKQLGKNNHRIKSMLEKELMRWVWKGYQLIPKYLFSIEWNKKIISESSLSAPVPQRNTGKPVLSSSMLKDKQLPGRSENNFPAAVTASRRSCVDVDCF